MLTPAMRHRQRVLAAKESAGEAVNGKPSAYEQARMQLAQHQRQLKEIQSKERKETTKRDLLPAYAPYVDGVLESGRGDPDDVLTTIMVWRIDAGDYSGALDIADYVLANGLQLPDRYQRTAGCLIAEEIAEQALRPGASVGVDILDQTLSLTADQDMPDEVRAKLHKALGFGLESAGMLAEAAQHLNRALELDGNSGVKKRIEQIDRALRKQQTEAPEA